MDAAKLLHAFDSRSHEKVKGIAEYHFCAHGPQSIMGHAAHHAASGHWHKCRGLDRAMGSLKAA
jgi:hypothetical protein